MLNSDLTTAVLVRHYADVRKRLMGKPQVEKIAVEKPPEPEPEPHNEIELVPPSSPSPPLLAPRIVKTEYPSIDMILTEVMNFYRVRKVDLLSDRRTWRVVKPRHVAIFLCRELTPYSLPRIGVRFGGRDHTTILHACNKINGKAEIDVELAGEIETIRSRIQKRHAEQNENAE